MIGNLREEAESLGDTLCKVLDLLPREVCFEFGLDVGIANLVRNELERALKKLRASLDQEYVVSQKPLQTVEAYVGCKKTIRNAIEFAKQVETKGQGNQVNTQNMRKLILSCFEKLDILMQLENVCLPDVSKTPHERHKPSDVHSSSVEGRSVESTQPNRVTNIYISGNVNSSNIISGDENKIKKQ